MADELDILPPGGCIALYPTKTRLALLADVDAGRVETLNPSNPDAVTLFPNGPTDRTHPVNVSARIREAKAAGWVVLPYEGAEIWALTAFGRTVLRQHMVGTEERTMLRSTLVHELQGRRDNDVRVRVPLETGGHLDLAIHRVGYDSHADVIVLTTEQHLDGPDEPVPPAEQDWSPPDLVDQPDELPDVWAGIRQRVDQPEVRP